MDDTVELIIHKTVMKIKESEPAKVNNVPKNISSVD